MTFDIERIPPEARAAVLGALQGEIKKGEPQIDVLHHLAAEFFLRLQSSLFEKEENDPPLTQSEIDAYLNIKYEEIVKNLQTGRGSQTYSDVLKDGIDSEVVDYLDALKIEIKEALVSAKNVPEQFKVIDELGKKTKNIHSMDELRNSSPDQRDLAA